MASLQQEELDTTTNQALLAPSSLAAEYGDMDGAEEYSMIGYFMTFVKDVYDTFLNLPVFVRVAVIFALLYTALKLM